MVAISMQQLTRRFGATIAVDRVDLRIDSGELFFLLGPSGCGKTTLMRMIAGLTEPTSGRVLFGERDVTDLPTSRRNTALVFQSYALWPHMTVTQNVAFGLDVRGIGSAAKRQRVEEVLRQVRIAELADRRPGQLSGGQQQRVALARALVVRPDVLLLDEPLSNLDAKLRLEMRTEIRRICKETGVTAIYVTHDQEEALSIADRIALMDRGRVVQVGSPHEVYARPSCRFAADFLGKANFLPATVRQRDNGTVLLDSPAGELRSTSFPADVPMGGNVTCSIRPEAIRVLSSPTSGGGGGAENVLDVQHVQTLYLGHLAQHTLEAAGKLRLSVEELKPRPRDWNQTHHIAFSPDDLVVLTD